MMYAIKEAKSNGAFVNLVNGAWSYVFALEAATRFNGISAVLSVFAKYCQEHPGVIFPNLTIVGLKEVTGPRFEEVEL